MLDPLILNDIIQRIVEVAQPEKVILFGSAARGDMDRHSDVDFRGNYPLRRGRL